MSDGCFLDEIIQNVMLLLFLSFILFLYLSVKKEVLVPLPLVLLSLLSPFSSLPYTPIEVMSYKLKLN